MGLFGKKPQQEQEQPLYSTSYVGFWIKVYPNRIDFKAGVGSQSIPLSQIASVQLGMIGVWQITLETTGGQQYTIPTKQKKEVQQAIYSAQSRLQIPANPPQESTADEIVKLYELKQKGIISEEDFEKKKKQLLG